MAPESKADYYNSLVEINGDTEYPWVIGWSSPYVESYDIKTSGRSAVINYITKYQSEPEEEYIYQEKLFFTTINWKTFVSKYYEFDISKSNIESTINVGNFNSTYINDEYGFSMEFPENWDGEFEINPYDYGLIISSELNDITTLAYIHKYTVQEWVELNYGKDIPVPYQILEESTEEIFALIYPGDVNYELENEKSVKRYEEMIKDLQEENFTFELNN